MRSGKSHFETLKHDEWNKPPKQVWTSIEFYTIYIFCFFPRRWGRLLERPQAAVPVSIEFGLPMAGHASATVMM